MHKPLRPRSPSRSKDMRDYRAAATMEQKWIDFLYAAINGGDDDRNIHPVNRRAVASLINEQYSPSVLLEELSRRPVREGFSYGGQLGFEVGLDYFLWTKELDVFKESVMDIIEHATPYKYEKPHAIIGTSPRRAPSSDRLKDAMEYRSAIEARLKTDDTFSNRVCLAVIRKLDAEMEQETEQETEQEITTRRRRRKSKKKQNALAASLLAERNTFITSIVTEIADAAVDHAELTKNAAAIVGDIASDAVDLAFMRKRYNEMIQRFGEDMLVFLCPITMDLITDPVVASDGQTYERRAIVAHMEGRRRSQSVVTSPLTGVELQDTLYPNHLYKQLLEKYPDPKVA